MINLNNSLLARLKSITTILLIFDLVIVVYWLAIAFGIILSILFLNCIRKIRNAYALRDNSLVKILTFESLIYLSLLVFIFSGKTSENSFLLKRIHQIDKIQSFLKDVELLEKNHSLSILQTSKLTDKTTSMIIDRYPLNNDLFCASIINGIISKKIEKIDDLNTFVFEKAKSLSELSNLCLIVTKLSKGQATPFDAGIASQYQDVLSYIDGKFDLYNRNNRERFWSLIKFNQFKAINKDVYNFPTAYRYKKGECFTLMQTIASRYDIYEILHNKRVFEINLVFNGLKYCSLVKDNRNEDLVFTFKNFLSNKTAKN
jgi:hypothetical protein